MGFSTFHEKKKPLNFLLSKFTVTINFYDETVCWKAQDTASRYQSSF